MAEQSERQRILDMLADGRISADDAAKLLAALGDTRAPGTPPPVPARRGTSRTLRVHIDAYDDEDGTKKAKIRVNVPIGLAKFASRFMPPEARAQLDAQGIDLNALLDGLGDELPEGPLVDIDVDDGASGAKRAKIVIEVA
jgi:hypothetical protein